MQFYILYLISFSLFLHVIINLGGQVMCFHRGGMVVCGCGTGGRDLSLMYPCIAVRSQPISSQYPGAEHDPECSRGGVPGQAISECRG